MYILFTAWIVALQLLCFPAWLRLRMEAVEILGPTRVGAAFPWLVSQLHSPCCVLYVPHAMEASPRAVLPCVQRRLCVQVRNDTTLWRPSLIFGLSKGTTQYFDNGPAILYTLILDQFWMLLFFAWSLGGGVVFCALLVHCFHKHKSLNGTWFELWRKNFCFLLSSLTCL